MMKAVKILQVVEYSNGDVKVMSTDKKQIARWYALDYLRDKATLADNGTYNALVSKEYYFSAGFRKKRK